MKKHILLFSAFCLLFAPLASAEPNPLYEQLSRAKEVKISVKTPSDSAASKLDVAGFKKAIEDALKARKSIRFAPVATEAEAQFVVEADIKGFTFSLTDPVDMLAGVGMAAMDAAKVDHFASTDVRFTVKEISGKVRWDDVVHASLTEATMTEEEARVKILDRAATMFMREAFGKNK